MSGLPVIKTSPSTNAAWLAVGSIIAVVALTFGTIQTVGLIAHDEHVEHITVDDPAVTVLDLATDGGNIEVVGADVDEITILARVSDGLVATDLSHTVVGNRLEVRVRCHGPLRGPWCRVGLQIGVPRALELKLRSEHDRITVRGIEGRVDAESSNGTVEAEGLSGAVRLRSSNGAVRADRMRTDSLDASTDNGSVRIEFESPPLSAIANSDNGSVEVSLPRDAEGYAVDISSGNGSIDNQVHTDSESPRRISATSDNGSVTVRYLD